VCFGAVLDLAVGLPTDDRITFQNHVRSSATRLRTFLLHLVDRENKKFELMLTRCAKAYSSSCSQTVRLSPAISSQFILGVCAAAENRKKSIKTFYFESSGSFKVIDVDTTEKLVTSACCDRQHVHAYLQPFSRKTGQQQ